MLGDKRVVFAQCIVYLQNLIQCGGICVLNCVDDTIHSMSPMEDGYCEMYESRLSHLERELYQLRKPEDIIMGTLEAVCEFYQADWSGILDADLQLGVWTPIWWYNAEQKAMTDTRLYSIEIADGFIRWEQALNAGKGIIITDVEQIRETNPMEYEQYKRMDVRSVIGAPYHKRSSGFLVVRNPKRFSAKISFLQVLTYVVASEVDELKLSEGTKLVVPPLMVKKQNEVYISLFGGLEIYTYQGKLNEERIKSPKLCRIIVYLLIHRKRSVSARELAENIWPDDVDTMIASVRSLIYRFRKVFRLICDDDLIETVEGKYHINPQLTVATDLEILNHLYSQASCEDTDRKRIHQLKKAAHLYKGSVYPDANAEHWLMALSTDYQLRFLQIEEELLELLSRKGGYQTIYDEAKRALSVEKGNMMLYYWMVLSLIKQGTIESAKQVLQLARNSLTEEDFSELLLKLKSI